MVYVRNVIVVVVFVLVVVSVVFTDIYIFVHMCIYVQPVRIPEIQATVVCRFTMYLRFNGLYNELCIVFGSHCTVHLFIYIVDI